MVSLMIHLIMIAIDAYCEPALRLLIPCSNTLPQCKECVLEYLVLGQAA